MNQYLPAYMLIHQAYIHNPGRSIIYVTLHTRF